MYIYLHQAEDNLFVSPCVITYNLDIKISLRDDAGVIFFNFKTHTNFNSVCKLDTCIYIYICPDEENVSVFQFSPLLMCQVLPVGLANISFLGSLYFYYVLIKPIKFILLFLVLKKGKFRFFDFSL